MPPAKQRIRMRTQRVAMTTDNSGIRRAAILAAVVVLPWVGLLYLHVRPARAGSAPLSSPANPNDFLYDHGQTAPRPEVRDPCILRDGDTYYLVFTMWPFSNRE